ncbi:hypothetical protein GX50_03691 [[Emmonsia] crescens]|uniref:Uncharacterized protein n=1 Tax=[Emmonsia] crescens TaxID=73230 RepID=A0A2B7ZHK8_9EURO|nr:hypothetical protein GX50_03691 [Emmonsia crescens]
MAGTHVNILVWRGGVGDDFKSTRHAALFFIQDGNKKGGDMVHVSGTSRNFVFQIREGYQPETSSNLAGRVHVALLPHTMEALRAKSQQVPINNAEDEWNCQHWVGEALQKFVGDGLITAEVRAKAVDEMVDIALQAIDDQPF